MLNETYYWSIPFGKWNGIPIRLHMLLFLAAALVIGVEYHMAYDRPMVIGTSLATLLMGSVVVISHVGAQLFMIGRSRVQIKTICLVPWGALYHFAADFSPRQKVRAYTAGMMCNLTLLMLGLCLLAPGVGNDVWEMVNPFQPRRIDWANVDRSLVEIFTWLNFVAVLLHLTPVAPLDGGYLLEAWTDAYHQQTDRIQRYTVLFALGQIFAIILFLTAYLVRDWTEGPLRPAWLWPVLSGIVVLFAARQHYLRRLQEFLPQIDFGIPRDNPTGSNPVKPMPDAELAWQEVGWGDSQSQQQWDEWMEEHHASREEARKAQETSEEALLDDILNKVGAQGLASLTQEERDILNRVSLRYRNRRELRH